MGRVDLDDLWKPPTVRKKISKIKSPPTLKELKQSFQSLNPLTDEVSQIKKTWVPNEYDISILTAKLKRLHLRLHLEPITPKVKAVNDSK